MTPLTISFLILIITCLFISCTPQTSAKVSSVDELSERVIYGDLESVRLTVNADNLSAFTKRSDGVPLLYFAAANGHKEILTYLLDVGANIDASTDYGSALHIATKNGYHEIVQLLLNRGANSNLKDNWKQTPLHYTTNNKNDTVVKLLIDAGSDINAKDYKGRTPLHRCKSLSVAKILISVGADVNAADNSGYTPLHWFGHPREIVDGPTVKYLLNNGADPSRLDNLGQNPRQLAVENEQDELVYILDQHKENGQNSLKRSDEKSKEN
tara:strand:- start:810 stop:1616 length:807 start_codon:yes stop_codon:yes gene_type:complete